MIRKGNFDQSEGRKHDESPELYRVHEINGKNLTMVIYDEY